MQAVKHVFVPDPTTVIQMGGFGTYPIVPSSFNGSVSIVEHALEPGTLGAPLHCHSREDEISYVLEGELTVMLGDEVVTAEVGSYLFKPRGQFHAFWNAGTKSLRMIEVISPGGFERYFSELSQLMQPDTPPDFGAMFTLAAKYGMEMDFSSVPMLIERFGVHLG
jgi:mannose-6-phosphate isomerase-like protein (cupin superfamily)